MDFISICKAFPKINESGHSYVISVRFMEIKQTQTHNETHHNNITMCI